MMFLTAGFFNMLTKEFEDVEIDIQRIFSEFKTDTNVLGSPLTEIDAGIVGRYYEQVVAKKDNHRIGLETGFRLPFTVTGSLFNICKNYSTAGELFADSFDFSHPTATDIHKHTTRLEKDFFYFEITLNPEFAKRYPVAGRQWIEMQYGIALQYAYSFTGRYLYPVLAYSIYPEDDDNDKLMDYLGCPVEFNKDKFALIFKKTVLDLPIITPSRDSLPTLEDYMHEIRILENTKNRLSQAVHRYLVDNLLNSDLSLNHVAENFNMSGRNLQRKLKEEGTSYQHLINDLRIELSGKYLKEDISFSDIASLLGFESQSAFNKFFRKHFDATPQEMR